MFLHRSAYPRDLQSLPLYVARRGLSPHQDRHGHDMFWGHGARIFFLRRYLFPDAHSFPRATLSENCSLLGTDTSTREFTKPRRRRRGQRRLKNEFIFYRWISRYHKVIYFFLSKLSRNWILDTCFRGSGDDNILIRRSSNVYNSECR